MLKYLLYSKKTSKLGKYLTYSLVTKVSYQNKIRQIYTCATHVINIQSPIPSISKFYQPKDLRHSKNKNSLQPIA